MDLRIKLIPYEKLKREKFPSLLEDLKEGTLILIDAKLTPEEESELIEETMKKVSEKFSGVEMSSLDLTTKEDMSPLERLRMMLIERILGKKRGLTIIGPAKIIRKIKRNPEELLLYM
jgi:hypothetical protein